MKRNDSNSFGIALALLFAVALGFWLRSALDVAPPIPVTPPLVVVPEPPAVIPSPPVVPVPDWLAWTDTRLLAELRTRDGENPATEETQAMLREAVRRGLLHVVEAPAVMEPAAFRGRRGRR